MTSLSILVSWAWCIMFIHKGCCDDQVSMLEMKKRTNLEVSRKIVLVGTPHYLHIIIRKKKEEN